MYANLFLLYMLYVMAIDPRFKKPSLNSFGKKWIGVGSISEYDVVDPLSTATMNKFLNKLEDEQRLFILENAVEWTIEHNVFIVSWDISVLFSHEHAVEFQLRWK